MDDLPIYQIKWEDELDGIIYAISIVDKPANKMEFITMNEQVKLKETNKEKQILTGVVLQPDQLVYRYTEDKGEYNLTFPKETIEKLSFEYLERGYQKNSTYNHEQGLEGISVVESWIVKDGDNDKAKSLGFNVPDGTWMVSMRLSDELWNEYIKTGKAKGFSIDAFLNQEKIDNQVFKINKNKNKKVDMLKQKLLKAINLFETKEKEEEVKMEDFVSGDKKYVANSFKEGEMVYVEDSDGERELLEEGSFEKDGEIFTTNDEGIVISVVPKSNDTSEEDLKEDKKEEEKMEKTSKKEVDEEMNKLSEDELKMVKDYLGLSEVEKDFTEKEKQFKITLSEKEKMVEDKEKEIEDLKKEVIKLKEELETTPADKKLGAEGKDSVDLTKMSLTEKLSWINKQVKENK